MKKGSKQLEDVSRRVASLFKTKGRVDIKRDFGLDDNRMRARIVCKILSDLDFVKLESKDVYTCVENVFSGASDSHGLLFSVRRASDGSRKGLKFQESCLNDFVNVVVIPLITLDRRCLTLGFAQVEGNPGSFMGIVKSSGAANCELASKELKMKDDPIGFVSSDEPGTELIVDVQVWFNAAESKAIDSYKIGLQKMAEMDTKLSRLIEEQQAVVDKLAIGENLYVSAKDVEEIIPPESSAFILGGPPDTIVEVPHPIDGIFPRNVNEASGKELRRFQLYAHTMSGRLVPHLLGSSTDNEEDETKISKREHDLKKNTRKTQRRLLRRMKWEGIVANARVGDFSPGVDKVGRFGGVLGDRALHFIQAGTLVEQRKHERRGLELIVSGEKPFKRPRFGELDDSFGPKKGKLLALVPGNIPAKYVRPWRPESEYYNLMGHFSTLYSPYDDDDEDDENDGTETVNGSNQEMARFVRYYDKDLLRPYFLDRATGKVQWFAPKEEGGVFDSAQYRTQFTKDGASKNEDEDEDEEKRMEREQVEREIEAVTGPQEEEGDKKKKQRGQSETAFALFCNEHRALVHAGHPNLSSRELQKTLNRMWKKTSQAEREPYRLRAAQLKGSKATGGAPVDGLPISSVGMGTLASPLTVGDVQRPASLVGLPSDILNSASPAEAAAQLAQKEEAARAAVAHVNKEKLVQRQQHVAQQQQQHAAMVAQKAELLKSAQQAAVQQQAALVQQQKAMQQAQAAAAQQQQKLMAAQQQQQQKLRAAQQQKQLQELQHLQRMKQEQLLREQAGRMRDPKLAQLMQEQLQQSLESQGQLRRQEQEAAYRNKLAQEQMQQMQKVKHENGLRQMQLGLQQQQQLQQQLAAAQQQKQQQQLQQQQKQQQLQQQQQQGMMQQQQLQQLQSLMQMPGGIQLLQSTPMGLQFLQQQLLQHQQQQYMLQQQMQQQEQHKHLQQLHQQQQLQHQQQQQHQQQRLQQLQQHQQQLQQEKALAFLKQQQQQQAALQQQQQQHAALQQQQQHAALQQQQQQHAALQQQQQQNLMADQNAKAMALAGMAQAHGGFNSVSQPPAPSTTVDALDFLYLVKKTFANNNEVYLEFLRLMENFKNRQVQSEDVIQRVEYLFRDYPVLLGGFRKFL